MTDGGVISIALDAMGGDNAPEAVIKGADLVLSGVIPCESKVHFSIYGKEDAASVLSKYKRVQDSSVFIEVQDAVLSTDRPSYALRHRKRSGMWCAIEDVKKGVVSAVLSSGNTGALMAMSRCILGTLHDIDRPAIATAMPSRGGHFVILDLGANVECSAATLLQFAFMGRAFARAVLGRENPKVGLLNIGEEEVKGTSTVQEAFSLLRDTDSGMNFYGYVEADEAFKGLVDVVVTDGFSGNIMLKTSEATADFLMHTFKGVVNSSLLCKLASCLLASYVKRGMNHINPKLYNGAMLLGLNGVVVKSHGSADAQAFAYAIRTTADAVRNNITAKITSEMSGT